MALTKETIYTSDKSEEIFAPQESGDLTVNQGNITHILSRLTDMYSDPILAAARETISNALDATMKMPEDQRKPVDVSVGSFDTTFTVRDYGIGMSPTEVKENFMSYGSSTKTSDFDAVGSYGLGSKSPLAYTSEFTVTTTRDGVTTAFKMSNTSAGFKYDILYIRETDRASGTIVAIPMRTADTNRFLDVSQDYQKYAFDLPIVVNSETSKAPEFLEVGDIVLDAESHTVGRVWIALDGSRNYGRSNMLPAFGNGDFAFVLSGYVYELPNNRRGYWGSRNNRNVIVELKPGLVDFTSSRDDISSTQRSEELIERVSAELTSEDFWTKATERILSSDLVPFAKKYLQVAMAPSDSAARALTNPLASKVQSVISDDGDNDALTYVYDWSRSTINPAMDYAGISVNRMTPKVADIVKDFKTWGKTSTLAARYDSEVRYSTSYSFVVITGVDEDNIRKALAARSKFVRSKVEDNTFQRRGALVFRDVKLTPENEELEELMGIQYYTYEEMLEVAAATNPPAPTSSREEFVLDAVKFSHDEGSKSAYIEDLQAFAAENPIIVLSQSTNWPERIHAYLENREKIKSDTVIYILDELQLRVYNAVKDTATFYHHKDYSPTIRSKAASEGVADAETISSESRSIHLHSKSDDELLAIAFSRYARFRYYTGGDDGHSASVVLTAILKRNFSVADTVWAEARREPADAAFEVLLNRLETDKVDRLNGAISSFGTLIRIAEDNPGQSLDALVQVAIDLPNGI